MLEPHGHLGQRRVLGRCSASSAQNDFIGRSAVSNQVPHHTNAIFGKLGFAEEPDLNRRVAAVLLYLQTP